MNDRVMNYLEEMSVEQALEELSFPSDHHLQERWDAFAYVMVEGTPEQRILAMEMKRKLRIEEMLETH